MPTIVHHRGGPSGNNVDDDGGGLLFSGITFFLSNYVPSKSHIRSQIVNNGGTVTLSENQAQIFITDHMHKRAVSNAPEQAVSYTFVEQSINKGELEDVNAHLISVKAAPPARGKASSRPAASGAVPRAAPKGGRTPFSLQDDNILFTFISRPGVKLSGNKIYQDIEQLYPHHSWHSWRDRWVRQLAPINPDGPPYPPVDFVLPPSQADRSDSTPPPRQTQRPTRAAPRPAQPPPRREPSQQLPTPVKMEPKPVTLAPRDAGILKEMKAKLMDPDVDLGEVCAQLKEDHPHHTYEAWMARVKIFRRAETQKIKNAAAAQSSTRQPQHVLVSRIEQMEREARKAEARRLREQEMAAAAEETESEEEENSGERRESKGKGRAVQREEQEQDATPSPSPSPRLDRRKAKTTDAAQEVKDEPVTPKLQQTKEPSSSEKRRTATPQSARKGPAGSPQSSRRSAQGTPQSARKEKSISRDTNPTTEKESTTEHTVEEAPTNEDEFDKELAKAIDALPADTPESVIQFIVHSVNEQIRIKRAARAAEASSSKAVEEKQDEPNHSVNEEQPRNKEPSPVYRPETPTKPSNSMAPPKSTPLKRAQVSAVSTPPARPTTPQGLPRWRAERRVTSETFQLEASSLSNVTQKSLSEPRVRYATCDLCGAKVKHDQLEEHKIGPRCARVVASSPSRRIPDDQDVSRKPASELSWGARVIRETLDVVQGVREARVQSEDRIVGESMTEQISASAGAQVDNVDNQSSSMSSAATVQQPPITPTNETPLQQKKDVNKTPVKGSDIVYETSPMPASSPPVRRARKRVAASPMVAEHKRQRIVSRDVISSTPSPERDDAEVTSLSSKEAEASNSNSQSVFLPAAEDSDDEELMSQFGGSGLDSGAEDVDDEFITQLGAQPPHTDGDEEMDDDDGDDTVIKAEDRDEDNVVIKAEYNEESFVIKQEEDDVDRLARAEDGDHFVPAEEDDEGAPASQDDSQADVLIQTLIDKYGVPENSVIYALERTSMDAELAEEVLKVMVDHRPDGGLQGDFPLPNIPGIFTEEEDDILRGSDRAQWDLIEEKHGSEWYEKRMEFLDMWDGEQTQMGDETVMDDME